MSLSRLTPVDVILYQIENEYTGKSSADVQYMADLEQQATSDGIDVPFTFNQCCGADTFTSGTGAVDISGQDNYPLGFNCSDTSSFGQPYGYPSYSGEPIFLPEYQGGSSSVSNLGMYGIKEFAAVINPPHGTILAVGVGEERVYVDKGEIKVGQFMTVTLSCDHRAVDGALGAELLAAFKGLIETPVMMLA